ncbi:neuronal acetylcholine receptor subunit eat-2-like isoform X1 [Anopheles merus]|uniref:neuronal acetylcholine receptor subunit eat-2-like isoform X1 n=1 Tax=Anopheles merus TaxID=30066 RepID=UPI001BE47EBE|nr:neuronal acetylcholine receptor subunit eat-2-like isoform X1 [Anopheles merus]
MAQTVGKYMCVALFALVTVALGQVVAQSEGAAVWAPTWAETLKKDLLKGYDPSIRPSQHYNVTTVETGITITHVEINEIKSTLSVYGWMKFKWYDARLAWEPQLNGNVTQLFLNQSAIWQPTLDEKGPLVKVTSNGLLEYTNALQQQSKCTIQWQRWPFDTQQCRMLFSPWAEVDGMEIHVKMLKYEIAQGTMWTVMNMTLETHTAIDVHETPLHRGTHLVVELKRNSGIYRSTITAPACVLILMNLLSFWLPPNCGEKLILNAINVLITCMFLIHFNEYLSYYTTSTPTVVLFFGQSLYLSGFCLLMTVVLECVVKSNSKKPLHPALKKLITFELIAMIISTNKTDEKCLGDEMCETLQDEQEVEEAPSSTRHRQTDTPEQDWLLFVTLLERIVFALYVIILSLMLALYF